VSTEPYLYATLKFTPEPKAIQIAHVLIRCRRKSLLVLSISAELVDRDLVLLPAAVKLVIRAIVGCPNLKSLSISWRPWHNWAASLLLPNEFQLHQFVSWFQWDQSICDFLRTQPSLKELDIVRPIQFTTDNGPHLSEFVLPSLSTFMGRLPQALVVLPGRPITSLGLYGSVTLASLESALPILTQASAQIQSLFLQAQELSANLLTLLSAYMPTLARLELRIVRSATVCARYKINVHSSHCSSW
jgi:hypothetical protein